MGNYEVWVLVDEEDKPVLNHNGDFLRVSTEEFAGQNLRDYSSPDLSGKKWYKSKRLVLSELKHMDWY